MAEAHSAVAFSFTVTPEGVDVSLNHEALKAVWYSGLRSWKKRIGRMKNGFMNGVYPASPTHWFVTLAVVLGCSLVDIDISFGWMRSIQSFSRVFQANEPLNFCVAIVMFTTVLWLLMIVTLRYTLKLLLTYTKWMYEPRNRMSLVTKIWLGLVSLFVGRKPLLYSYQGSLPKLPIPSLNDTMSRYLRSVRPLLSDEQCRRMEGLVEEFRNGLGRKLQWYLVLKSWWATNYVSDWWEEYVYLRGRSPIMVNSNFYGMDAVMQQPTTIQAARAANVVYAMLQFRRLMDREELRPFKNIEFMYELFLLVAKIMLNKTVPLCSWQYERQFNTTRIPGIDTDTLVHWKDSTHIVVYHRGRYFKVYIYYRHQLLSPSQIEHMLQQIIDDCQTPMEGEEHLAALTAGDRILWAKARASHFSRGVNKTSLDAIEKAAFVLILDDEPQDIGRNDSKKLDDFGHAMLHGKGYDRWFDKSFTLVVCSNGRIGFNAEHSWADAVIMGHSWEFVLCSDYCDLGADAPIMGHLWETTLADELKLGYTDDGHTKGQMEFTPPKPVRLQWELSKECQGVIETSLCVARDLLNDVDLHLLIHDQYGKGFIKKCNISPDAYIQMALQLTYFRDAGKFCLTYEASMTRMFREGRTETIRSCTLQSCAFVKAMEDPRTATEEKIRLLQMAGETHQEGCRDAMTGRGIDRHLFCLYVVSKYLGTESPFLKEVLSEPWRLSTSQTPHQQTDKLDLTRNPEMISAGGGFGPEHQLMIHQIKIIEDSGQNQDIRPDNQVTMVADDGYGVSYIIAGEDVIFFHISSKKSCPLTNSTQFGNTLVKALDDMKQLFIDL